LAGKTVLGHVLDKLLTLPLDQVVFIVGHLGDQLREFVERNYALDVHFVVQRELLGQAHAIALARKFCHGPILIVFVDTLFEADLSRLPDIKTDGVALVSPVDDPRRFGIVTLGADGLIRTFVEKPAVPVSNLAIVGVYYIREGAMLLRAIDEVIARDVQTSGEYYLADALQIMVDNGARLEAWSVNMWEDCGTVEAVLQANRHLLSRLEHEVPDDLDGDVTILPPVHLDGGAEVRGSVIGPHVFVGPRCTVLNAVVGPNVSLADESVVRWSLVRDSIVNRGAVIEESLLSESLIGENASVRGSFDRLNVGDYSQVHGVSSDSPTAGLDEGT
jgi:glucose-1-phosphate thymidylyltransferase